MQNRKQIEGALLGEAIGDAIGLPREGLSPQRARALFGVPPLEHALFLNRGMVSDDTEHACMTAQALLSFPEEPESFARSLGWRLRGWLVGLPAGIGFGTLRAIAKLWIGFSPAKSGVFSAGNGPAMRAPVLGVCLGHSLELLKAYIRASTSITHTDEKAYEGALVIALAAHEGARLGPERLDVGNFFTLIRMHAQGAELLGHLDAIERALSENMGLSEVSLLLGWEKGVSGYINQTVPASLYAWLKHRRDVRAAIEEVIMLGGDTDTTAAITGALAGATVGSDGIPLSWLEGLVEWPRSVSWIKRLAARLEERFGENSAQVIKEPMAEKIATEAPQVSSLPLFWPGLLLRNGWFCCVVLTHGFRRLFPPYRE